MKLTSAHDKPESMPKRVADATPPMLTSKYWNAWSLRMGVGE